MLAIVLWLVAVHATGHEHWVHASDCYPPAGSTVTVHVCSGHYFPESSLVLQDKVIAEVVIAAPDGQTTEVQTTAADKCRTGTVVLAADDVHLVALTLQRPNARAPS